MTFLDFTLQSFWHFSGMLCLGWMVVIGVILCIAAIVDAIRDK